MSLFTSLRPLAQTATLTLLITAEGDQLRVNVTPRAHNDPKGEKTLYPLSILASAEELDRDFAEAVAIYEPSALSVLDQARAANAANSGSKGSAPALPAPGKPGRPRGRPKNDPTNAGSEQPKNDSEPDAQDPPVVDPRQTSIPGIDPNADAAATQTDQTPTDVPEQPAASSTADGEGIDVF